MSSICLIWSIRLGGWVSASGGAISDHTLAKQFDEAKAIEFCNRQKDGQGVIQSFPVPLYLIETLT